MRFSDWPERLNKIISDSHSKPFEWGEHDCCLFAANVVLEITGIDYAAELRGSYSTALQAARVLKEHGGVRGIAASALGEEISPMAAQRGDIVLISPESTDTLAVCIGVNCIAPAESQLVTMPMSQAITAWRVL